MQRKQLKQVVLVTGGRDYERRDTVYGVLDMHNEKFPIRLLVQGGAKGADAYARDWAFDRGIRCDTVLPNWKLGRTAGFIRNQTMLDEYKPRLVVSFPGGNGTTDCTRKAYHAGCKVDLINGEDHGRW
jgi:hypothetical protein